MIVADVINVYIKKPIDGYFVLGQSFLDQGLLGDGTDFEDIAVEAEAITVDINYGNDTNTGFDLPPRAGVASIRFQSETLDPGVTSWVKPKAELWVQADGTTIFKGVIQNIDVTYPREGKPQVRLEAQDVVSILANKVWPTDLPAEGGAVRLARFDDYGVSRTSRPDGMGYFSWVNMNALKSGYTFLEVLNLAMASEGGLATVKRDGIFNCYQMDYLADTAVEATFTDIPADIDHAAGVLSYTDIQASYSTRALCNNLTIINKDVAVGEEVETVYGPFTNSASAEVWGASKVDVTMNYASGGAIPQRTGSLSAVGAEIVAKPSNTTPQIRVSSIDFTVDATDADLVDIAKTLTTFSKVQVQYHTETNTIDKPHIIVGVKHSISPTKWKVSYDLMQLEELI